MTCIVRYLRECKGAKGVKHYQIPIVLCGAGVPKYRGKDENVLDVRSYCYKE